MSAQYRFVHYVPDPFLGGRVPVAALVQHGGKLSVVRAPHMPGPNCLGGSSAAAVVEMLMEDLDQIEEFDELPEGAGPQAMLDEPLPVPADVVDPVAWVSAHMKAGVESTAHRTRHRSPNRATFGYRFFEAYGVHSYVRSRFHPGSTLHGYLGHARALPAISHYVQGDRRILLMEPVLVRRQGWEHAVSWIATTFGAYKTAMTNRRHDVDARLVAYVLAGGRAEDRAAATEQLAPFADEVVHTSDPRSRENFLEEIRQIGHASNRALFD